MTSRSDGAAAGDAPAEPHRTHAPRIHGTGRIERGRVALVALAALGLVWQGAPPADPAAEGGAEVRSEALDTAGVERVLGRANPILSPPERARIARAVTRYSAKYDLDPELVTAVILVESGARPSARSPKGALGLMQVMPHMLAPLGLAGNATTVESNVEAGCWILAHNIRRLGEERGILAYFWGSNIQGDAYLERVQAARAEVRRHSLSS